MCKIIVALRRPWDKVDIKYVFIHRMAEKECSLMALQLVAGIKQAKNVQANNLIH